MKSTGRSGKYFRAVVTSNREKPKEEDSTLGIILKKDGRDFSEIFKKMQIKNNLKIVGS